MRLKNKPWTTDTEKEGKIPTLEGKEKQFHLGHIAPSQDGTAPTQRGTPAPVVSPVGKQSPRWTPSSPSIVGYFLRRPFGTCLMGISGDSLRLGNWESDRYGEKGQVLSWWAIFLLQQPLGREPSQWLCPSTGLAPWAVCPGSLVGIFA